MTKYLAIAGAGLIIAFVTVVIYAKKNKKEFNELVQTLETFLQSPAFKDSVHKVMVAAEQLIVGDGKGQERLAFVCGMVNKMLPVYLQPVVTVERLEKFVNALFKEFAKEKGGHTVVE